MRAFSMGLQSALNRQQTNRQARLGGIKKMNRKDFAPGMKKGAPHAQMANDGNHVPGLVDQLENLFK